MKRCVWEGVLDLERLEGLLWNERVRCKVMLTGPQGGKRELEFVREGLDAIGQTCWKLFTPTAEQRQTMMLGMAVGLEQCAIAQEHAEK